MVDNRPVALISGGGGGLAAALRAEFHALDWNVQAPVRKEMDVCDRKRVDSYFSGLNRIDALVCNAGIIRDGFLARMPERDWDEVMDTNLTGAFHCIQAALPIMLRQKRGHILLISSSVARRGAAGQSNYAAAKAGLVGLGKSIAREHGADNMRCNIVFPGFLETKLTAPLAETAVAGIRADHVLGRLNTVENAARFIAFLAGIDHVSGQVFNLDSRIGSWV
jgi:3-oxoacyl-[acyl-carrier protein] reductase